MEILTNTSRERLISIAESYVVELLEDRGNSNIEDLASAFANAGFTKSEFFQILDKYYLSDYTWAEEIKPTPTTKEIDIGDSDQAILETALTQIGIKYEYHNNEDGVNWIEIKGEEGWGVEIQFNNDGQFLEIYC